MGHVVEEPPDLPIVCRFQQQLVPVPAPDDPLQFRNLLLMDPNPYLGPGYGRWGDYNVVIVGNKLRFSVLQEQEKG